MCIYLSYTHAELMLHTTRSIPLLAAVGDHQDQSNGGWVSERAQLRPQCPQPSALSPTCIGAISPSATRSCVSRRSGECHFGVDFRARSAKEREGPEDQWSGQSWHSAKPNQRARGAAHRDFALTAHCSCTVKAERRARPIYDGSHRRSVARRLQIRRK